MFAPLKWLKNPILISGLVLATLFAAAIWYSSSSAEDANNGVQIGLANIKGNPEAKVTLVEYSDFQCPACAQFQPALEDVLEQFGNQIKIEFKHFPLPMHSRAILAARAAEAAGQQGKFFEFHDILFARQTEWTKNTNAMASFVEYANEIGLDITQFKRQYNSSIIKEKIQSEQAEGFALNITATPTFYLNGVKMEMETFEDFYNQIAQAVGATTTNSVQTEPVVEFGI